MWGAQGVAEDCSECNGSMQHSLKVGKCGRCGSRTSGQGFGRWTSIFNGKISFQVPSDASCAHAWDAGHLFEEISGTLLCSDLFHQDGDVEAVTNSEIVSRFRETLIEHQKGPLANYLPYTTNTEQFLNRLAALKPKVIAPMHGSTFVGDGQSAIFDLVQVIKDVLDGLG